VDPLPDLGRIGRNLCQPINYPQGTAATDRLVNDFIHIHRPIPGWVLSKPLTRPSFILSKVIANCVGILVTMIIVPFCISFAILSIGHKSSFFSVGFVETMGVIFINHFFFLSMTLMLGTFFNSRGPVIGIPLAVLFLQQNILFFLPSLRYVLPWNLIVPLGNTNSLVISLVMGTPVQSDHLILLLVIALESFLFTLVAVWRFNKEEF
jgi:ABC-2 type transport system permease protein